MIPTEEEIQLLAETADAEIQHALAASAAAGHTSEQRAILWETVRRWLVHPEFLRESNPLRSSVLNQLAFTTSVSALSGEAFAILREMTAEYPPHVDPSMAEDLVISAFECYAEQPEVPETLEFLFNLAGDPATRWATFEAYRFFPWWLPPHALKYSNGHITPADCGGWFTERFPHCEGTPRIVVDWSGITREEDFYDTIAPQCGFPSWHGRNLDALNDSWVTGGIDANGPPYIFELRNPYAIPPLLRSFFANVDEIAKCSWMEHNHPLLNGLPFAGTFP